MAIYIRRRELIVTLGGATAWPLAARAQQPEPMRRIGVLMGAANDSEGQAPRQNPRTCPRSIWLGERPECPHR
jgi:hypothetical protein